jgi:dihydroxy-acid dehydratase
MARRAGVNLTIDDFDLISKEVPFITDVKPCGDYTVEELYHAGGVTAVMKELEPLLDTSVMTANGKIMKENLRDVKIKNRDIIHPLSEPIQPDGGLRILRGNLAPDGAVLKVAAASPNLLKHKGPATILGSSDGQSITADHVIINRYKGPIGAPGMPEAGPAGIPTHVLRQGVRDMVRVTDARMSGTSFGTVILHVAPEAAVGGPLAIVEEGDMVELDAEQGALNLLVEDNEIQRRLANWSPPPPAYTQGYRALWLDQVTQAPDGCDFKFCCQRDWLMSR